VNTFVYFTSHILGYAVTAKCVISKLTNAIQEMCVCLVIKTYITRNVLGAITIPQVLGATTIPQVLGATTIPQVLGGITITHYGV